jgi:hypothetical protein
LQNHLSFPKAKLNVHNVFIGNMVFQVVRAGFPLKIAAGMTRMGSFAITSLFCKKEGVENVRIRLHVQTMAEIL